MKADAPPKRVFFSNQDSVCSACGSNIERSELTYLPKDRTAYCLVCADLDHLIFLPSGNTALTGRAVKYSAMSEIVWAFSASRRRNERQGVLVTQDGLDQAEDECFNDAEVRERKRIKAAEVEKLKDSEYHKTFAAKIRALFPNCPTGTENEVAHHACEKYSGRVGRSAAAKALDEQAVILAVRAHVRHNYTDYDHKLAMGYDKRDARQAISENIDTVLSEWITVPTV